MAEEPGEPTPPEEPQDLPPLLREVVGARFLLDVGEASRPVTLALSPEKDWVAVGLNREDQSSLIYLFDPQKGFYPVADNDRPLLFTSFARWAGEPLLVWVEGNLSFAGSLEAGPKAVILFLKDGRLQERDLGQCPEFQPITTNGQLRWEEPAQGGVPFLCGREMRYLDLATGEAGVAIAEVPSYGDYVWPQAAPGLQAVLFQDVNDAQEEQLLLWRRGEGALPIRSPEGRLYLPTWSRDGRYFASLILGSNPEGVPHPWPLDEGPLPLGDALGVWDEKGEAQGVLRSPHGVMNVSFAPRGSRLAFLDAQVEEAGDTYVVRSYGLYGWEAGMKSPQLLKGGLDPSRAYEVVGWLDESQVVIRSWRNDSWGETGGPSFRYEVVDTQTGNSRVAGEVEWLFGTYGDVVGGSLIATFGREVRVYQGRQWQPLLKLGPAILDAEPVAAVGGGYLFRLTLSDGFREFMVWAPGVGGS
ncbi:MAG: hypothetical protein QJR00_07790, partial [Bacillota bacterium]|nr:hypothetical protein [Bacillota bacterium]